MKTFSVSNDTNLKDFTDSVYPQASFCFNALLKGRDIKVNGVRTGKNIPVKKGDEVVYYTNAKQEQKPSHSLVYEDDNIYIADKYSGVSSEGLFSELLSKGEYHAVHRLDRNTQGLIIYAKNREAEDELLKAFNEREIEKTYLALCKDRFKEKSATLTAYLKKDGDKAIVKIFERNERVPKR